MTAVVSLAFHCARLTSDLPFYPWLAQEIRVEEEQPHLWHGECVLVEETICLRDAPYSTRSFREKVDPGVSSRLVTSAFEWNASYPVTGEYEMK